jgi:transcriptional regulator with XRE-family HTH domain
LKTTGEIFTFNLRRLREERGYTQADAAEKTGYSVRGYQKYEQGESEPTPDVLDRFAKAFRCTVADLVLPKNPVNEKSSLIIGLITLLPSLDEIQLRQLVGLAETHLKGPALTRQESQAPSLRKQSK